MKRCAAEPYDATSLGIVDAVVAHTLKRLGDDAERVEDMCRAVSDTCANITSQAGNDRYEVEVCIDERSCTILLHDLGPTRRRR